MQHHARSIRPFIGAKDYQISRQFYLDFGFKETILSENLSYFSTDNMGFYLQDAYIPEWIDNTMVFMEVADLDRFWDDLVSLKLTTKYKNIRIKPIHDLDWGRECFVHDPSGVLWHIGAFYR
ncbi:hypothetical protein CLV98_10370 [Dyadobacter jejuensis]|uniref:Catechol 2,3-dioxygenase-like lactoylglutathione lyase family enzyme n=1 Tax=Dyadobacter jejuensis TaxID=1082580 RepID=A0A316ALN1_9BACT|nr:glyoxalase [Dyadobacter jejuensis]PWJ58705.1 hypothetical protein CLV98_10370 [Dyadobacter jejuensis]